MRVPATPHIGSLFSGYAGLDIAVTAVLGAATVWHSEIDPAASKILANHYPNVPNYGDIATIDWSQVEPVDVVTGGFPCQDVSSAGRRAGLKPGTRSGLWEHMVYAIEQLRPQLVVIENVRGLASARAHSDMEPCPWCVGDNESQSPLRALGAVLGDLANLGYDARWYGLRAADVGAPHGRFRIFIAAHAEGIRGGTRWAPECESLGPDRAGRDREHLASDTDSNPVRKQPVTLTGSSGQAITELGYDTIADTTSDGRHQGWPESTGLGRGSDAPERSTTTTDSEGSGRSRQPRSHLVDHRPEPTHAGQDWGAYEPAIRRWEHVLRRPSPAPTERGRAGNPRLSPRFVEWLMGLPDGWVTQVPGISRNDQLKVLGNGVVPQQANAALRYLLTAEAVAA